MLAERSGTGRSTAVEDALGRGRSGRGRLIAVALLALIVLTGLAVAFAWRQYEDAKDDSLNSVRARAVLAASVLDAFFAGQLSTLSSIAASPEVVSGDTSAMTRYFRRVQPSNGTLFPAGLGWIDSTGAQRATSNPAGPVTLSLADRSYFRNTIATEKPFVSEAFVARVTGRRLIVMAVPTRDTRGRISGVLAGGTAVQQPAADQRSTELGFVGLQIIDRKGQQLTSPTLARPENTSLLSRLRSGKEGVLTDVSGLDGADGHVVAYATSAAPDWKIVIDQPASSVFASARHALRLALAMTAAAALFVLALLAWAMLRARRDLRAERAQLSRWAGLTRSLNEASEASEVCDVLATSLAAEFPDGLVAAALYRDGDEQAVERAVVRGARSRLSDMADSDALQLTQLLFRTGIPLAYETAATLRSDTDIGDKVGSRARSLYGAILSDGGRKSVGAVAIAFAADRALDEHQRAFVQAHADQVAQALARIRRHEDEHNAAIRLQRSLLPERLPDTAGVEFGAHYQAGSRNTQVGGDWYDVVRRPDGILQMTVGDVAGRGIPAAVLMGQLRNAFRAYAQDVKSPAEILRRLSRHVGENQMATAICVMFDPYARELIYASAGHPPPLLLDPDTRTVTRLDGAGTPPLGWPSIKAPSEEVVLLPARATLVLYTDGLIERRGTHLEPGIEQLSTAVAAHTLDDVEQAAVGIVAEIVEPGADDDAALLLVQMSEVPAELEIEIPAQPDALHVLRRRVRAWLLLRGLDQQQREDAVLSMSEACNNAIEHAYNSLVGTVRIHVGHQADMLHIVVDDEGTWREAESREERGRGLLIMKSLMDEADVIHKPRGTRITLRQRLSPRTT